MGTPMEKYWNNGIMDNYKMEYWKNRTRIAIRIPSLQYSITPEKKFDC